MDNCPVQNRTLPRQVVRDKRAKQLKLPPMSGDIHCIENFFHAVKVELDNQALELNIIHAKLRKNSVTVSLEQ